MFNFSDVVSLSTETKQALANVNAFLELMRGIENYEHMSFDDASKNDCLHWLENVLSHLRTQLGVCIEDSLTSNPPKEFGDTII